MNRKEKTVKLHAARIKGGALIARNRTKFKVWDDALDDNDTMASVFEYLSKGNYIETAVVASGIPKTAWAKWKAQGTEDREHGVESKFAFFMDAIDAASAASEAEMVQLIRDSADRKEKLPIGYCWLLERVRGHRFKQNAPPQAVQVQVNVLGVAAAAPDVDYKTGLASKELTDEALKGQKELVGRPISGSDAEVPVGIETITVGKQRDS